VSSAILYLAIIAIWAGFLVPAWLRRPNAVPDQSSAEAPAPEHADVRHTVEFVTETENDVEVSVDADIHVEVSHHEHAEGYADEPPGHADMDYAAAPESYEAVESRPGVPGQSQSREQMLRARRRLLTILVAMTLVTVGFAYLGLVRWWICVPPAVALGLYVLVLREIVHADAELARKRGAWEAAQARAYAQYLEDQAEREAYETSLAGSGAQVIDISGRVSDELYDQYADAAVRAVGD
jgi:hypothetical protein